MLCKHVLVYGITHTIHAHTHTILPCIRRTHTHTHTHTHRHTYILALTNFELEMVAFCCSLTMGCQESKGCGGGLSGAPSSAVKILEACHAHWTTHNMHVWSAMLSSVYAPLSSVHRACPGASTKV